MFISNLNAKELCVAGILYSAAMYKKDVDVFFAISRRIMEFEVAKGIRYYWS